MTGRAALERFHFPIVDEFRAVHFLQFCSVNGIGAPLPAEVGDFVQRTDVRRRVAMAIQTKTHAQRLCVAHFIHLVNASMTFDATDAARDVDGVIEINVIGRDVNLHPRNRRVVRRTFADERESRIIFQNLAVTIHAS